jgi:hypothetical protein
VRRPPRMGEYEGRGLACRRGTRSLEWSSSEPAAEGDRGMVRPAWGHVIAEDHGAAFPLTRVGRAGSARSIHDPRRFVPAPEVEELLSPGVVERLPSG